MSCTLTLGIFAHHIITTVNNFHRTVGIKKVESIKVYHTMSCDIVRVYFSVAL